MQDIAPDNNQVQYSFLGAKKKLKVHDNVSALLYPPTCPGCRAMNPTVVGTTITLEPTTHAHKSGAEK